MPRCASSSRTSTHAIPTGFTPGKTAYEAPSRRAVTYGVIAALVVGDCVDHLFHLPWHATVLTIAVAWPLCVMNGRVTGDTDINPVRLVAIVVLTGSAWMISSGAVAMLGMAVIGGTIAAVAVDMMQNHRTGYLIDANPTHQTAVQFAIDTMLVGSSVFAAAAVLSVLLVVLTSLMGWWKLDCFYLAH